MQTSAPDTSLRDLASTYLRALLRIDTTNLPGNERFAADYIARIFDQEDIGYEIVDSAPNRASIVGRIQAEHPTGRPILLMGHTDVVSVERDKWDRDPFGGELVDDYIWGRGALDMKGQVAAEMAAMVALRRANLPLTRDIIFAAFADEEAGGEFGADYVWKTRPDLLDAEFAINEGGGSLLEIDGVSFYLCQAGEKGSSRLRIVARATPGHASVPLNDTAMKRMGEALVKLHAWQPRTILTAPLRMMLESIAAGGVSEAVSAQIDEILLADEPTWAAFERLPFTGIDALMIRATTRNTAVPTMIHGGQLINVIPSEVTLDVDGRLLPGEDPEAFRDEVQEAVGDEVEVELVGRGTGTAADPASPFFDAIKTTMARLQTGIEVIPYLMSGGTDAPLVPGVKVYGFCPILPTERLAEYDPLVHGHNERIHLDDLEIGARFMHDLVVEFCTSAV
jgi:acetylornithine deacetylase/succinyl-diaminopimelate desuccinylase-like protein